MYRDEEFAIHAVYSILLSSLGSRFCLHSLELASTFIYEPSVPRSRTRGFHALDECKLYLLTPREQGLALPQDSLDAV